MAAITVTATESGNATPGVILRVMVLTGAAAVQNGGKAAVSGNLATVSVTTTQTNSRVYGVSCRGSSSVPTENAATARIDAYDDVTYGNWYSTWKAASLTATPGATVFGYTGAGYASSIAALEILTSGTLAEDASGPAFVSTVAAFTVTTASFTPPAGALLVALVSGGNPGGAGTSTMAVSDTSGLSWAEVIKGNSASQGYAGVWIAQVAGGGNVTPTAHIAGAGAAAASPTALGGQGYGAGAYGAGVYTGTLLYEDAVDTPAPTTVIASLASTAVSNTFLPGSNTLVVVIVGISFHAALGSGPVVTVADSLGTSYAAGPSVYDGAKDGVYYFTHRYTSAPGTVTVTATRSNTSQAGILLSPRVVRGAAVSQAGAGSGSASSGSAVTAVSGVVTAALAESILYAAASMGALEASLSALGTSTLSTFNDATDAVTIVIGRAPGITFQPGPVTLGWTASTATAFAFAGLEIFGTDPVAATAAVAGSGAAGGAATAGAAVQATAKIAGQGTAGAGLNVSLAAPIAGAGIATGITFNPLFGFSVTPGAGDAEAIATVGGTATAPGTGAATATPVASGVASAAGSGAAVALPVLTQQAIVGGSGVALAAPPAAGMAAGSGAAVAVPTVFTLPGTAQGAGAAVAQPAPAAAGSLAGAGVAGAVPVHRATAGVAGAGKVSSAGLPIGATASVAGAGAAVAIAQIVVAAGLTGVARIAVAPAGAQNTDDTIEPGPCTLAMSVGPTVSRAPFSVGSAGPDGSTVGGSTPAMAVGNTVSDRGN